MATILTTKFKIDRAIAFKNEFALSITDHNHYLFVGQTRPWAVEIAPPMPQDHLFDELRAWDHMLALKKVVESGTSHVIPLHAWDATGETVYVEYSDNDADLFFHPTPAEISAGQLAPVPYVAGSMFMMTDEFHVFKCLDNNGGAKSTVKPAQPISAPFIAQGADGYRWQYMYTVNPSDILKFVTDAWIPVQTLESDDGSFQWDVQQAATDGSISHIKVVASGTGYVDVQDADPANPDPQLLDGATATTATLSAAASGVNNAYNDCTIWIVAGLGAGQSRRITSYVGATKEATVDVAWSTTPDATSQYKVLPTVVISGNGDGSLSARPDVVGGLITRINVINGGADYLYAEAYIEGGSGSGAEIHPVVSPRGGHGSNALYELGGFYVMINVKLAYDEGTGDFFISNDYRQLGIIKNVLKPDDDLADANTLIAIQKLQLSGVAGAFSPDDQISGSISGTSAVVVEVSDLGGGNVELTYFQDPTSGYGDFTASEVISNGSLTANGTLDSIVPAEAKKYSGDILVLENRRLVMRASNQTEDIKIIVET